MPDPLRTFRRWWCGWPRRRPTMSPAGCSTSRAARSRSPRHGWQAPGSIRRRAGRPMSWGRSFPDCWPRPGRTRTDRAGPVADGITVERDGPTAVIWLDRPDRGNAFTAAMQTELHRQLHHLDSDESVRAIVVTGRGRHFSTGADMEPGGTNFAFDDERHRA